MNVSDIKNATVLIIDNELADAKLLQNLLKNQGYRNIHFISNPSKKVNYIEEHKPDLILLDYSMIDISGFDDLKQLKNNKENPQFIPVIVITPDISKIMKQKVLEVGVFDFISKPFDITEVEFRVKNGLFTKLLMKEKAEINQKLDNKVQERTKELARKNIQLERSMRKLEASDRLKTAFIHNISHEVRTPLNGIVGLSEILMEKDLTEDEINLYAPMFYESIDRLLQTITDYMDVSLLVSDNLQVQLKKINVAKIISEKVEAFKAKREDGQVAFIRDFPGNHDEFLFHSDEETIRKIVFHLLSNASKFTKTGRIIAGYKEHANGIIIFVSDTGLGIPIEEQDRIFDHFVKAELSKDINYEGSGLGLTIVKGLAEYYHGWVKLDSEPGKGSDFQVFLSEGSIL